MTTRERDFPRRSREARAAGVTLVEVMVSIGVLAFGLTAAANLIVYSSRAAYASSHVTQASMLAQSLLTTLMTVPYTSSGTGTTAAPNTFFTNSSTANDSDIADVRLAFAEASLAGTAYDHLDSELTGAAAGAIVAPLPSDGSGFERYWNIVPIGSPQTGVAIAVIVRWKEAGSWQRTVLLGTRYAP
jgi:Tfp pilus assembly protein PilV